MRLNGVIDDLQTKLRKNAERLATTEQSVARQCRAPVGAGDFHARIVALAGEVKQAQSAKPKCVQRWRPCPR